MSGCTSQSEREVLLVLSPQLRNGLRELLTASDYALNLACSPWDFSVEIGRILPLGVTTSDLRWLIKCGHLSHAREITGPHDTDRRFDSQFQSLAFFDNTCFVLTETGRALLRINPSAEDVSSLRLAHGDGQTGDSTEPELAPAAPITVRQHNPLIAQEPVLLSYGSRLAIGTKPVWDRTTRMFMVGEHLVKHFRVPSPNQAAVLDAFQEEGWPHSVDDPLSPLPDQQQSRRLRDTIKCLNQHQISRVVRFRGDGTGQRVLWQLLIGSLAADGAGKPLAVRDAA
jgi:hypothetical protein